MPLPSDANLVPISDRLVLEPRSVRTYSRHRRTVGNGWVRVRRATVHGVIVDLRGESMTFGPWIGLTLSTREDNQLLIPERFAHGLVTLDPETEVQYKSSRPSSPAHDRAIRFDDPAIGNDWIIDPAKLILSPRDRAAPLSHDVDPGF